MRFAWIEEHRGTWPVAVQCEALDVSRSGFYAWRERPLSGQSQRRELLLEEIRAIHHERRKDVYGSPRIHQELTARGRRCNVKTVARIMKERGIRAKTARTFKVTTDSKHDRPVATNVLDRAFGQTAPNQAWVSDITYVPTRGVVVSGGRRGPVYAQDRGLVDVGAIDELSGGRRSGDGHSTSASGRRPFEPFRSRKPIRERALPGTAEMIWDQVQHEPSRRLLGQRADGEFFCDAEEGAGALRGTTRRSA